MQDHGRNGADVGAGHAREVRSMFSRIAGRYDLMNRLMTFGRDRSWRRRVVAEARLRRGDRLLDLGTGTGEIARVAHAAAGDLLAVGADFTLPMMEVGRARPGGARILWVGADALRLPFPDASFDAVTSGYLLRNVSDPLRALREQARVVRPGGRVVCLDTTPPRGAVRPLVLLHLRLVIPLLGRLVTGDAEAYRYLPSTTERFRSAEALADLMREAGLAAVSFRRLMLGTVAIHAGVRPA